MTDVLDLTARLERLALECQDCGTEWVARTLGLCPHCGSTEIKTEKPDEDRRVRGWRTG